MPFKYYKFPAYNLLNSGEKDFISFEFIFDMFWTYLVTSHVKYNLECIQHILNIHLRI